MMHFVLQTPSLQHLAAVKTVASLWTQRDILTQIAQTFTGLPVDQLKEDGEEWKAIEEKVRSKFSTLPIPETCERELFNIVKPIGLEILAWCAYNCEIDNINNRLTNIPLHRDFFWTMHGTVDYARTAASMVKDDRLSVTQRFEIACFNCLEDEAGELIYSMSAERRREYVNNRVANVRRRRDRKLIIFFMFALKDNVDQLNRLYEGIPGGSINKRLFFYTLRRGSRATSEYFLKKLNREEKEQVFDEYEKTISHCRDYPHCNLMHYLSLMNAEQQRGVFRRCTRDVLIFLLGWPMQSLFSEAVKCGWGHMNKSDCVAVLNCIIDIIKDGCKDYDYSQLFWECWRVTTAEYKQFYLNDFGVLDSLFKTKEEEFIKLVFYEATLDQILELFSLGQYLGNNQVMMDGGAISDVALVECKETAVLMSLKDRDNMEKRLRSEYVGRLIDLLLKRRMERRMNIRRFIRLQQ